MLVKPDSVENGDIKEADMFNRKIRLMSKGSEIRTSTLALFTGIIMAVENYICVLRFRA